jgi:hypothetical protein
MRPRFGATLWYLGRFLQLFAMWILLVDIFMAGPMGPAPKPFYVGVATFIAGWLLVRWVGGTTSR